MYVTANKLKIWCRKMGYSTTEVGDLVAEKHDDWDNPA